jgi:DNA primase
MIDKLTEEDIQSIDIEYLLERESIDFKLGHGVSGVQLNLRTCPKCGDDRWRTYYGVENFLGNCFVCGQAFSIVTLIHSALGSETWRQTFEEMREVLRTQGWRPKRKAVVAIDPGEVKLPINTPIPDENGAVIEYLAQRGMDAETCRYFGLGFCEFGWWRFRKEEEWAVQNFANRIIIPVCDLDGTIKTFQGRDTTGKSDRKYLFPSTLPGTGRYLLNGQNFQAAKHACMGEGFFDVAAIKMAMDGDQALRDVIALGSFGKHLSYGDPEGNDQLGRLYALKGRGLTTVTMMWDGEVAALTAALDAARKITSIGLSVRISLLPKGKDPNEVTPDVVRAAYYAAKPFTPTLDMMYRLKNPYA